MDLVAEQIRQAMHDGKTEAEAAAALTRGVVELVILLEDRLQLPGRDAIAGIADLDGEAASAPPAAEQDLAALGVFQGVRKQVADHLLQQSRIAAYRKAAGDHAQSKTFCLRVVGELVLHAREQIVDRELDHFGANGAGLDLVYVEQCVQHA